MTFSSETKKTSSANGITDNLHFTTNVNEVSP